MAPKTDRRGFTLIELMIVVVIIGLLTAMAIPRFNMTAHKSKEKEADGIVKQVYTLQLTYHAQHGAYANTVAQLESAGFEAPAAMQNYTFNTTVGTSPYCLTPNPATASWSQRCIDFATGEITN